MTTRDKLVEAAAKLLDAGGEQAVTLLGVGHTAGVSHNAPYKHFKNRDALLAAVATSDLDILTTKFVEIRVSASSPGDKLLAAIGALIAFCLERPSRYRLVFGAPTLAREHPELQVQSTACLSEIVLMVDECKSASRRTDQEPC